jgi:hypothetical protein
VRQLHDLFLFFQRQLWVVKPIDLQLEDKRNPKKKSPFLYASKVKQSPLTSRLPHVEVSNPRKSPGKWTSPWCTPLLEGFPTIPSAQQGALWFRRSHCDKTWHHEFLLSLSLSLTHHELHESSGRECQNLVYRNFIPIVASNLPQLNQNHNEILVYMPVTDTRRQTKPSSLHHFYALSVS